MKPLQGLLMLSLFFIVASLHAQPKKYKTEGIKCTRVEIIDPSELYSMYLFDDADLELMKIEKIKPYLIDKIQNTHTEDTWPSEFGNFDTRINNPDKVKSYTAYLVCKLNDKYLLVIPAKYNGDKGEGWAPTKDIYLIIGEKGVKV